MKRNIKNYTDYLNEEYSEDKNTRNENFKNKIEDWIDAHSWSASPNDLAGYLNDEYSEYTFDSSWPKLSDDETIFQEITCNGKTFISYTTDSDGIYIGDLEIYFDALD